MKTYDQEFLKEARIESCEIAVPRWMAWRDEEVEMLRNLVEEQGRVIYSQEKTIKNGRLAYFAGFLLAGMLMIAPVIARL